MDESKESLYRQYESLAWLIKSIDLTYSLPPLRGWAASPDVLLYLHEYIREFKPLLLVEFGSGASTLVIADALKQNAMGKLISIDHSSSYARKTQSYIDREGLNNFVELKLSCIEPWSSRHMNINDSRWYSEDVLGDINSIDLVFVDGPPRPTCKYARYPALPVLFEKLAVDALVVLDDANRDDEIEIVKEWVEQYSMSVDYFDDYDKGMAILKKLK